MNISFSTTVSTSLALTIVCCYPGSVAPFLLDGSPHRPAIALVAKPITPPSSVFLFAADDGNDEYDDFYADFDPSDYEIYDQGSQSSHWDDDQYTRDIDADNSPVDSEAVIDLIKKRSEMRSMRQYKKADSILDDLLENFGVMVRDKDRKWRTGCSQSKFDSNWLHASTKQKGNLNGRKNFGPKGHDYVYDSDAGPSIASISEEKIDGLLAEMLSFKFKRDYDGADAIQEELLSAGVLIDGKTRKWRADGKSFSKFAPNEYKMFPHAYDISHNLKEIEKLISERALARAERLFRRSDEIRDDLLERFDVRINDKLLLWSVGADQTWGKAYESYTMSDRSAAPSDAALVEKLVKERDIARGNRDFGKADELRSQLLDLNVTVDDKKRIWYVHKGSKTGGRTILNSKDSSAYIYRGRQQQLPPDEFNEIQNLVNERDGHKKKKRYRNADAIRSRLLKDYGVRVEDGTREWYVAGNEYCMAQNSAEIDEESRSKVEEMIKDRTLARGERDYEKADTIKNELFEIYNVAIDDINKEWRKKKSF